MQESPGVAHSPVPAVLRAGAAVLCAALTAKCHRDTMSANRGGGLNLDHLAAATYPSISGSFFPQVWYFETEKINRTQS